MRALLIGGGGREHAIGLSILKGGHELTVISPNRNPGLASIAKKIVVGNENDKQFVLKEALKLKPDYVFIGPESPIENGVSDILLENGFKVFAPSSVAAKLETSKAYCRRFMFENRIKGNVRSEEFTKSEEVSSFIRSIDYEFVVKPDGLTGGKGVVVQGVHFKTKEEGIKIARDYLKSGMGKLLVEEKMLGEEFSLQAFVKGKEIYFLPAVQDYKRAFEGDIGPNTGGMGSVCFSEKGLPFIPSKTLEGAKGIMRELVEKFSRRVTDYVGPIYGGFIATREGPKLLEINARLGDPEAINVLSLMEDSIVEVAISLLHGLDPHLEFRDRINVLRYLVPKGYGSKPTPSKMEIDVEGILLRGLRIYYASVNKRGKYLMQTTSRSVGLLSEGRDLTSITKRFEGISSLVKGDYSLRNDIGTKGMIEGKVKTMSEMMKGAA